MFARTTSLYLKLLGCLIVGGTAAAGVTAAASAGASPPIVATALGAGTLKTPVTLKAKAGAMAVEVIKVAPGGDFGWHTHGSAVAACAPQQYSKGAAFIEPADHLHRARNNGKKPVTLYATYIGLPKGVQPNIAGTAPAGCA